MDFGPELRQCRLSRRLGATRATDLLSLRALVLRDLNGMRILGIDPGLQTTLFDFNLQYQDYLKEKAWKYLFIGINSLIFSLLPFVLIIAYFRRRKRMKQLPDLPLPQDAELEPPQEDS